MSTRERLLQEIAKQPEAVLRDVLQFLLFLEHRRQDEEWNDVLADREVQQEVLDLIDSNGSAAW